MEVLPIWIVFINLNTCKMEFKAAETSLMELETEKKDLVTTGNVIQGEISN